MNQLAWHQHGDKESPPNAGEHCVERVILFPCAEYHEDVIYSFMQL